MPKCVYCGKMYENPKGLTLIMKDGTINHLCSPKCRKNMAMKRRKVRWISKAKKTKADIQAEIKAEVKEVEETAEAPKIEVKEEKEKSKSEEKPEEKKEKEKKPEDKKE